MAGILALARADGGGIEPSENAGLISQLVAQLSHRGQRGFSLIAQQNSGAPSGYLSEFPAVRVDEAALAKGLGNTPLRALLGHVHQTSNDLGNQPFASDRSVTGVQPAAPFTLHVAMDGGLVNTSELAQELSAAGMEISAGSDVEILTRVVEQICLSKYVNRGLRPDYVDVFREVDLKVDGAVSAVLVDDAGIVVAYRNWQGLRPLGVLQRSDVIAVASEIDSAIAETGSLIELQPSQIAIIDSACEGEIKVGCVGRAVHRPKKCVFETLYLGHPRTRFHGETHWDTRRKIGFELGALLGETTTGTGGLVVASMPKTGIPYADGLFEYLQAHPHGKAVVREELVEIGLLQRTLIGIPGERKALIERKYSLRDIDVTGRDIVVVDEALIRGDTSQAVARLLFDAGAHSVHWVVGSPPFISPSYYGLGVNSLEELIFWQIWSSLAFKPERPWLELNSRNPQLLNFFESLVAKAIGVTRVTYLPFHRLTRVLPGGEYDYDCSPFTFRMPTPIGQVRADEEYLRILEQHLGKEEMAG
ncbi:amidophosphoribosyltransferase [Mycobacterium sp. CBMA271]|uniref:amidophosphoribosyltransferase n=1 Tax=unclassified Mycobacteroides TaxID=2618759 RepID=UPI0012DDD341|nr:MULTISPECIES: amidophosphoribosyltransferase [unclassified Mycobacteroides]MUM18040.1 amidophosphoribosyltransferase [Mycobacteroides sp. CBMA 326]MUM23480.1 amidophosphoribosyltransferase [Mycobacteroides sp. CBMA 271]